MAFSFGTPASSGTSSGGLFGTAGNSFGSNQNSSNTGSSGGLFGNVGASSSSGSASPSLFGTSSAGGQTPSLFGKPGGTTTTGGNTGFSFAGQGQTGSGAQPGSLFGGSQTPNKTTESIPSGQTASSGLFSGANQSGGGLFGNTAATPAPAGGSLFGSASTTPAGPPPGNKPASLFGGMNAGPSSSTPTSASSTTPTTSQPASGGFFGTGAGSTAAKPLFGTTASPAPGGGLFGAANKDQPAQSTTPTTATESGAPKPLFGAATTPATGGAQTSQTSSLFPMASAGGASTANPAFPSLGAPSSTTSAATTTSTTATAPTSTATTQKPMFPSLGGTTSTTAPSSTPGAAPAGGLFPTLGAASSTPATTSGTAAATTTAAAPATTSTTQPAAPAGGLFGKPATSTPSTQPAVADSKTAPLTTSAAAAPPTGAATGATTTAGLGASTAGPPPPAQSRLKNKTMDEIITRWATDLTKYQKDFRDQAEKVAEWDRMLVENGTKVQKLYGSTVDAERATQEVERQLASVEGQQEELISWLDRYEREVDEMVSKQVGPGESLQGPDQERERTYKLAEKLSERLDEMGKDLTSMIEEVNGASATLSKTNRADEPISQIVRILNAHLSQLQVIDQGTSELQAKVGAAQKAGQSISSRLGYGYGSPGMGGANAADDFYRSYMGRR